MLMTIGGVIGACILLGIALWKKMRWLRNFVFGAVAVWFAFYGVMLFGASLSSKETTLALNEPKAFCGFYLDCHMHTAVTGVRKTGSMGDRTASGEFYIVKIKVFSDAVRAELGLNGIDAGIVDDAGARHARDLSAEVYLGEQPSFEKVIGPEESFEKTIVFDLPVDTKNPRLDIRECSGLDRLVETVLVDDEDSILHKRNLFKLEEQNQTAGVQ